MNNKLVVGILALSGASAVNLGGHETTSHILKNLNREVGNVKYVRKPEKEVFHLDNILGDFYDQFGHITNRGKIDYTVPKVRYQKPKPYSWEVTQPSLLYREVEHIAPPKYESPKLRDLAEIDPYPEGYTNIYEDYTIENYFGSDGSDHRHFRYDNIDKIDLDHGHWNPDPHAKSRPIVPDRDNYFVTVVNNPAPVANYDLETPLKYQKNPGTYKHPELGVDVYLVDDTIVPGQKYTPDNQRPKAITTLKSLVEAEDYDGPNFDINYKLQGYERPKAYPKYKPPTPEPYESPFPAVVGPWYGERTFEEVGAFNRDVPVSAYDDVVEEPVSTPEPVHIPEPELFVPEPTVTVVEPEVVPEPEAIVTVVEPEVIPEPEPVQEEEPSYMRSDFQIPTTYQSKSSGYLSDYGRPSRSSRDEAHDDSDSESDHSDDDSDSDDEDYLGDYNIGGFRKFGRTPTYSRRPRTSSRRSSDDKGYTRSYRSRRSSRPAEDVPSALASVSGASWLDALF